MNLLDFLWSRCSGTRGKCRCCWVGCHGFRLDINPSWPFVHPGVLKLLMEPRRQPVIHSAALGSPRWFRRKKKHSASLAAERTSSLTSSADWFQDVGWVVFVLRTRCLNYSLISFCLDILENIPEVEECSSLELMIHPFHHHWFILSAAENNPQTVSCRVSSSEPHIYRNMYRSVIVGCSCFSILRPD